MKTNWIDLGIELGAIKDNFESGGTFYAEKALEKILGEEWIKDTVDKAILFETGSELAKSCLRHIGSEAAVNYAYEIYKTAKDLRKRKDAVWIMADIVVGKSFEWVEEFLNDPNVSDLGLSLLDQLLWNYRIDYDEEKEKVDFLLELAMKNSTDELRAREKIRFIKEYLEKRENEE